MHIIYCDKKPELKMRLPEINNTIFILRYASAVINGASSWCGGIFLNMPSNSKRYAPEFFMTQTIGGMLKLRGFPKCDLFRKVSGLRSSDLTNKGFPMADVIDFRYIEDSGRAFVKVYTELIKISRSIANIKNDSDMIKFLIAEQLGAASTPAKIQEVLDFYEIVKDIRFIIIANYSIVADFLKLKSFRGEKSMQNALRRIFDNRDVLKADIGTEPLSTLNKYQALIGNERFLTEPAFTELVAKLKDYGITLEY